ncbi:tetratricopeptide repeat protein 29-like [Branchiostoma lanceolatum]|uniref:tetratricopeptide repeat protein 29-like n=1 Tax=Branchiostoma lanceolatum TaxID=7740 RepID=UPI0034519FE9
MATLPAISPNQGIYMGGASIPQRRMPSPPKGRVPKPSLKPVKRVQGTKDRDMMMKQQNLRVQQPELDKLETARYRNSYKHNLCLEMLREGFHKSFTELFQLMKKRKDEREEAGQDSLLWQEPLLEDQPEKLDQIKHYLTRGEAARRMGNMEEVYHCQYQLAKYFQSTSDTWLSDHFFQACLQTSLSVRGDGRRKEAEANCNIGLAYEERGEYDRAAQHFVEFHELASGRNWKDASGKTLEASSCDHLSRIYTTIADQMKAQDPQGAIQYLAKAFEMAKEGGDSYKEGLASYRLGKAYESSADSETAILYLNGYLEICKANGDDMGFGQACEAIAKSYESQGKIEESIQYLEAFVDVAERTHQDTALVNACSCLGVIYNSLGKYGHACQYFGKAYETARELNNPGMMAAARVQYGVSNAHHRLGDYAGHLQTPMRYQMERMIEWKDVRFDEFDQPITERAPLGHAASEGTATSEEDTPREDAEPKPVAETGAAAGEETAEGEAEETPQEEPAT